MKKHLVQSVVAIAAGWFFLYGSVVSAASETVRCGIENQIISAIGYGTAHSEMLSEGQLQIMAIRAAKMDAFRALAERVEGVKINGQSTVSSMISKSDQLRVRVDALVRGASVVSINPIQQHTFEVVVDLKMTPSMLGRAGLCHMDEQITDDIDIVVGAEEGQHQDEVGQQQEVMKVTIVEPAAEELNAVIEPKSVDIAASEGEVTEESIEIGSTEQSAVEESETIRDGLDMDLVEKVRKNQPQAPLLLRDAILEGMDREVALASVLTGMVEPNQLELENVINQAVALGLNRDEADRAVNRVKQACSACEVLEVPSTAPLIEIESGPEDVAQSDSEVPLQQEQQPETGTVNVADDAGTVKE